MQTIPRHVARQINELLTSNKVIVITGTRRTGKTFLLRQLTKNIPQKILFLNGEDLDTQAIFAQRTIANYRRLLGDTQLLVIDEAQAIPDIGKSLKLMIDELAQLTIIATGSSAFELNNQVGEPLTGRKVSFDLYPIAQMELQPLENLLQTRQNLEERLIFGSYPEVIGLETTERKIDYLRELVNAYLLKDILMYEQIRHSQKLLQLLQLIAWQVGSEVSLEELGKQLNLNKSTVERYLDLLTKVFILFRVGGFSGNLRKEVVKTSKWYFFDNGIRNTLINDFSLPAQRRDMGALWENYLFSERLKHNRYERLPIDTYFWRTYEQAEIDLIERKNDEIHAFEFKWSDTKQVKVPLAFSKAYPNATFEVISRSNYLDFVVGL